MEQYKMEDGGNDNKLIKMGATGNPNAARLATLQERKKSIEESLAKCNQELRQLCIQEADLTGTIPQEMPLEPGESPPSIRRRVGTAFQLSENLIKNTCNKDESIADLELQIQVHANMAEAALGLANEQNISKTLRRQHMAEYQKHKSQFTQLQEQLTFLKERMQQNSTSEQIYKLKKKPRPVEQDDNISITTSSMNESFGRSDLRYSIRSNKCSDLKYNSYRNSANPYMENSYHPRQAEDVVLTSGLYRLSINGYKQYMERRENIHISAYNPQQHLQHLPPPPPTHYQHQMSPHSYHQQYRNPCLFQPVYYQYHHHQIPPPTPMKKSPTQDTNSLHRQSSPSQSQKMANNTRTISYSEHNRNQNPHQIQPHQQYEQMTSGLGGYWKRNECGEMIWCNNPTIVDSTNCQRDKRFGSLDRRKNKRLHKRISPNVDNRSATMITMPSSYTDHHVRTASIKSPQIVNRRSQDQNRQLVRTQSLGSVGAQTIDSVWPSDDNSSCESDNRSIYDTNKSNRKPKQKEWLETSLDGLVSPTHSIVSRSQSAVPSILSPEEKYLPPPPPITAVHQHDVAPIPPPKPPLEIPAESNPSARLPDNTANIELFNNNNIPKNCTIVQAGHCKPYHEETKPFEMSDYYKYSTKFKKSPIKQQTADIEKNKIQKNLNETFDYSKQTTFKSPGGNTSGGQLDTSSLNSSLDLSQITNANIAEHFSEEMNVWYKNQRLKIDSNNGGDNGNGGSSTATLV